MGCISKTQGPKSKPKPAKKKLVLTKKQTGAHTAPEGCRKQVVGLKPRAQSGQKQHQQKKTGRGVRGAIGGCTEKQSMYLFFLTEIFHFDQSVPIFFHSQSASSLLSQVLMPSRTHEDSGGGAAASPPEKKKKLSLLKKNIFF
jgi:hypothetical protein